MAAVASHEQWAEVYDRLAALIAGHRTTLIFVNTRRLAERVAHHLAERVGEEHVASHHGSLSKERRLQMEQRLKRGDLRALVATASLELGIDIGSIDLVCQIGSPRAISTFLQRVGRSGHALGLTPRGKLFPTTRDELVECAALVRAVRAAASTACSSPSPRSTCWRSRSSPRPPARIGRPTLSSTSSVAPPPTAISPATTSTTSWPCCATASARAAAAPPPSSTTTASTASSAAGAARA